MPRAAPSVGFAESRNVLADSVRYQPNGRAGLPLILEAKLKTDDYLETDRTESPRFLSPLAFLSQ